MMKELGAALVTLGVILLVGAWGVKREDVFLLEIIFGPIFIYSGLQLLK